MLGPGLGELQSSASVDRLVFKVGIELRMNFMLLIDIILLLYVIVECP